MSALRSADYSRGDYSLEIDEREAIHPSLDGLSLGIASMGGEQGWHRV